MYRQNNSKQFLILSLALVALASFVGLMFTIDSFSPTGNLIAQGGNISRVDINQTVYDPSWSVVYGVFDESSGISNLQLTASTTVQKNMTSYGYDSSMVVIGYIDGFNQQNITQANTSRIDSYLGMSSSNYQSGTNTFDTLYNISIGNTTLELYGTQTISTNGTFITAVFESDGNLGFVATTTNGSAFDASPAFFQLMLPVNSMENYTFEVVSNITCPQTVSLDAFISQVNNISVISNWTTSPDAVRYELYYVDSLNSSNYLEFYPNQSINTTASFLSQNVSSSQRFYEVVMYLPVYSCASENQAGFYRLNLTPSANLISFPFELVNDTVEEVLRPVMHAVNSLNRYNNSDQSYDFFIQFAGSIFKNFNTVNIGEGYWLTINESVNLSLAGRLSRNISIPLFNQSNLVAFPFLEGNTSVAYTLRSIDGNYSTVNVYDNSAKSYDFYIIFGGSVFSNFNTIEPTLGYWLLANETETLVLP